jgi:glucose-1-phosphate thymidylyltransferase
MSKVVILAAGAGTRMRRADASAQLTPEQERIAAEGIKAMIPIGRPFLDYVLTRVADAGYRQVCLVVGPQHDVLRQYYRDVVKTRLSIHFAVQPRPLGTANAVAASRDFVGDDSFLVINSDNCYPASVMAEMRQVEGGALAGFDRRGLTTGSNIPAERVARFAILQVDTGGYLRRAIEKPDPKLLDGLPEPILVSMNCWKFTPAIFTACDRIVPSVRGEFEIPDAVMYSIEHLGQSYRVFPTNEPVLDLSSRQDIEPLARHLSALEVRL